MKTCKHFFISLCVFALANMGFSQGVRGQSPSFLRTWDHVVYPGDSTVWTFTDPAGCQADVVICSNSKVIWQSYCIDTIFMEPYSELTICWSGAVYLSMSHHCTLKMDTSFGHPFPARINSLTYDPLGAVFIDTSLGTILASTAVPGLDLNYNGYASGESPCDEASVMESFERRLTLYPSPSDGILNIEIPGRDAGSFDIRIFDIFGQVLREERLFLPGQTNLSNLSPGIYFIEARNKVETMTRKFVLL